MSSIQPVHVHFPALLEQPPIDRVRKRGLVYPKLAQSKGSGDRMHSPDLFWGSRRVSAVLSGPEPGVSVPRGMVHLSKLVRALSGIPALSIRNRTSRFEDLAGASGSSSSSERASSLLFSFRLVGGVGGSESSEGSRYTPTIEDDDGQFAPSSPLFLSTPISSYSSGTSASGRDSENSFGCI